MLRKERKISKFKIFEVFGRRLWEVVESELLADDMLVEDNFFLGGLDNFLRFSHQHIISILFSNK